MIRVSVYIISLIIFTTLLQSCMKVGPDYQKPDTKMPDSWYEAVTYGLNDGTSNLQTWWTVFKDPILLIQSLESCLELNSEYIYGVFVVYIFQPVKCVADL